MQAELTHDEACKLVEDAVERCYKTLMYIRLKLSQSDSRNLSLFEQDTVEQANLLCNINWYGAYLRGAKAMYRALCNKGFLDHKAKKEDRIIANAQLQAYMESARNMEWLLADVPASVAMQTVLERDKKGKVINAKTKFVKKTVKYEKI